MRPTIGERGEILRWELPRLVRVSWLFGPDADEWPERARSGCA